MEISINTDIMVLILIVSTMPVVARRKTSCLQLHRWIFHTLISRVVALYGFSTVGRSYFPGCHIPTFFLVNYYFRIKFVLAFDINKFNSQ